LDMRMTESASHAAICNNDVTCKTCGGQDFFHLLNEIKIPLSNFFCHVV
jgi:hypothetical protein